MSTPAEIATEPTPGMRPGRLLKPLSHWTHVKSKAIFTDVPIGTRVLVSPDCEIRTTMGRYVGGRDREGRLRWYAVFVISLDEQPFFIHEDVLLQWVAFDP